MTLALTCDGRPLGAEIGALVVAGWTGRDPAAVRHHIDELAAIGIAPPSRVPLYYRAAASLLTRADTIEVLGEGTSGEVEPLLVRLGGRTFFGLGSDHTDRDLETHSVAASKQACAKPVAAELWDFDEIAGHAEDIRLRCWIEEDGQSLLYQDGTLAGIRPLAELIEGAGLVDGMAMLCGTFAAIGGVRPARAYRMEARDPHRGRTIGLAYSVRTLPVMA